MFRESRGLRALLPRMRASLTLQAAEQQNASAGWMGVVQRRDASGGDPLNNNRRLTLVSFFSIGASKRHHDLSPPPARSPPLVPTDHSHKCRSRRPALQSNPLSATACFSGKVDSYPYCTLLFPQ
ncbi:hypothetical protein NDU88_001255 [Pleurodeles waltl]|uniref:Uncharacterized protein n=1 Tax=Pleurodeles waltl TaxID=8319 RepID=A0AAV7L8X8_PLEWA|nr:hypothetical protein NDU88_001255 [Pleurodeles waltl]